MSLVRSAVPLSLIAGLGLAALPGCDTEPTLVHGAVHQRIDLAAALGVASPDVTGVTVDPIDGTRFVLDASSGIYRLDEAGTATLVLAIDDFPTPDVPLQSGFLDIAAMGDGRFALVAKGDGYLLDMEQGTLSQWFCYEPGWMDPEVFEQESHNLAYDIDTDQILSSPVTLEIGELGETRRADVAVFDGAGAGDLQWFPIDSEGGYGGLAIESNGGVLLGIGDQLMRYELGASEVTSFGSLAAHGVESISGLMFDFDGRLMVLDAADAELVVLDIAQAQVEALQD